jgi:general secretion pathway protein J
VPLRYIDCGTPSIRACGTSSNSTFASLKGQCRRRPATVPAGFTLLEVLVALTLLGLLLIGLGQGTSFGLLAFYQQSRLAERGADLDAVDRTLRRLIQHAAPGSDWEPLEFVGTAHSVTFTTALPVPIGVSPTTRADVQLAVDAAHRLTLVWSAHLHAIRTEPPPAPAAILLLPGVNQIELSYWPARQGGWTSVWRDSQPPRLVRMRIALAESGAPPPPDLVASTILDPP